MFNLGAGEITVILLLALIFLGPKKLPDLASGLGKLIREIRKATSDVKNQITLDDTFRKPFEELRDAVTLHPDELKRRDQIQKMVEETKKRVEAEAARAEAEAAAAAAVAASVEPAALGPLSTPATPAAEVAAPEQTPTQAPMQAPTIVPPAAPPAGTVARTRPAPPVVEAEANGPMSVVGADESVPSPFSPPSRPTPPGGILTSAVTPLASAPPSTPSVLSLAGDRANATQTLSEADLLASLPPAPRKPPPPLPGLDRNPPPANRMGLPRVTPPVSSLAGDRANATQILSESDLAAAAASKPPPLPGSKKT